MKKKRNVIHITIILNEGHAVYLKTVKHLWKETSEKE